VLLFPHPSDPPLQLFKYVLAYLRARASSGDTVFLPDEPVVRHALLQEARYYGLPGLESLLEEPSGGTAFNDIYREQTTEMERYIAQQPFASIKELLFDILTGQKPLKSAWNPGLEQGTILVSLMNAPVIRISFAVAIHSDHVQLADAVNRFKVVLPDQLLESVFSGYYEIYLYDFSSRDEKLNLNKCLYNLGTRAVLLRMLQEQQMFEVRMVYDKKPRGRGTEGCDYELVLEFHRRLNPSSPRISQGGY
jgi:hypothetical protein